VGKAYFCLKHRVKLKFIKKDVELPANPTALNCMGEDFYLYKCPIDNKEYRINVVGLERDRVEHSEEIGLIKTIDLPSDIKDCLLNIRSLVVRISQGEKVSSEMISTALSDLDQLLKNIDA